MAEHRRADHERWLEAWYVGVLERLGRICSGPSRANDYAMLTVLPASGVCRERLVMFGRGVMIGLPAGDNEQVRFVPLADPMSAMPDSMLADPLAVRRLDETHVGVLMSAIECSIGQ